MKIDLEIFSPELVKIDSRSSNSTNSSGVRNPFNFRPTQKIFSFLELDSRTDLSRSYGDASKGGSGKSQVYRRIDLELVILVAKKDLGFRPVINLKNLNKHIPYIHFKWKVCSF